MNLNLIIKSDKKYKSSGTGVFVRDSGGARELQTLDEIKVYYPDLDLSNITQEYYETYNIWEKELDHNLAYLASHVSIIDKDLYQYLWKPSEIGYDYLTTAYIKAIDCAVNELKYNIKLLDFGSQEEINELLNYTEELYECISKIKIRYSDEFKIIATR